MLSHGGHSFTVPGTVYWSLILQQTFAEWLILDSTRGSRKPVFAPKSCQTRTQLFSLSRSHPPSRDIPQWLSLAVSAKKTG